MIERKNKTHMTRVITFFSRKGGTCKTTNSFLIGQQLAASGKRVLFIDTDPQGSLSILCSIDIQRTDPNGLTEVILGKTKIEDAILNTNSSNIDIWAVKEDDELLEKILYEFNPRGKLEDGTHLKIKYQEFDAKIQSIKSKYDFVIIDTNPSFGPLNYNAIYASDTIISCILPDDLSRLALDNIVNTIEMMKSLKKITHIGCIIGQFEGRLKLDNMIVSNIKASGFEVLGIIPRAVDIKNSVAEGKMPTNKKVLQIIKDITSDIIKKSK